MSIFKQIITAAILLAPVVGIAAPKTSSSERNMAFIRFLGTDNGFSGASVNWLHQDSHGYLWIGSIDGLVRYDGVNSQLYKKEDLHTGSSAVSSVYEDGGGNIWIGTEAGLTRYDYSKGRFVPVTATADNGVAINSKVNSITADSDGKIWLSIKSMGICSYDPSTDKLQSFLYDPASGTLPPKIQQIVIAQPNGDFILSVYFGGLWRCSRDFSSIEPLKLDSGPSFLEDNITDIYVSSSNILYTVSSNNGLCELSLPANRAKVLIPHDDSMSMYKITGLPDGTLLMAGSTGLYTYNPSSGETKSYNKRNTPGLMDDHIYSITTDKTGGILLGGAYGTVSYSSVAGHAFSQFDRLESGETLELCGPHFFTGDSEGNIWATTSRNGLLHFDKASGILSSFPLQDKEEECFGICYNDGSLWIGLTGRILEYDLKTKRSRYFGPEEVGATSISDRPVYPIVRAKGKNSILFCHALGIAEYDCGSKTFRSLPGLEEYNVNGIAWETDSIFWFSTYAHGLLKYDIANEVLVGYPQENTEWLQKNKRLNYVFRDSASRVWVGSEDSGLMVLFPGGESKVITAENSFWALGANKICGICEDWYGNVWVSTSNGLTRFSQDLTSLSRYTESDGLLNERFLARSAYSAEDGTIWMGSKDGLISFTGEESAKKAGEAPKLLISNLTVENNPDLPDRLLEESIDHADKIVLKHNQNTLSFTFSRPNLPSAADGYILCKLEGFDTGWHRPDRNNTVTWRFLPGGKYRLLVKSFTYASQPEATHKPLTIIVKNTPLTSPLAKVIYLILILGVITYLSLKAYRYLLSRAVERQRLQMEEQIASTPERKLLRTAQLGMPVYSAVVSELGEADTKLLNKIDAVIDSKLSDEALSYEYIANTMCVGKQSLNLKFKGITGITLNDYIRLSRLCASVRLLADKELQINEVCYRCGFNTPSYYSKCFKNAFGMLPQEYREQFC